VVADGAALLGDDEPAALVERAGSIDVLVANLDLPASNANLIELEDGSWLEGFDANVRPNAVAQNFVANDTYYPPRFITSATGSPAGNSAVMADVEDRVAASEDRFQCDAEGIAELTDGDGLGDDIDSLDYLRLGVVGLHPIPKVIRHPVGVFTYLRGQLEEGLLAIGEEIARLVHVAVERCDPGRRHSEAL
jgi:hypothetical protein